MSENVDKRYVNENLENNLNDLNINSVNDENSDYESCEESVEQSVDELVDQLVDESVDESVIDMNNSKSDEVLSDENEIQTDDEFANQLELSLSEEELNARKLKSIDLKIEGNQQFKEGLYETSIELYTKALRLCPTKFSEERAVMYGNRSAARRHLNLKDKAIDDCSKAIQLNPNYIKAILRRAQLYRDIKDKLDDSLNDYKRVLELDPNCSEAIVASKQLSIEINDRNEKMKTEMLGKLKDLGNIVLRPFGLSTDNFKVSQNSETGSYSVNFQNN